MKPNQHRKLELNRETVRDLDSPELLQIHGGKGGPPTTNAQTCVSCLFNCGHVTRDPEEPI